jgi:DNA invertase Pin-like site-specific DNA recombinase
MTKAYGYIRCSGLGQMDKDGPLRQREAIAKLCAVRNLQIDMFFQESHTGSDLDGRVEFHRMRNMMLENGVRTVVCEKMDRIARDVIIQESIIADFNKHGIVLLSATPGEEDLCSKDPTRVLIRQILGAFFEFERKMIELKTRAARERLRAKNGKCEGRKAYGTRPGEDYQLDMMLRMSERGFDSTRIASELNGAGHRTRYGNRWNSGTVWKIIERNRAKTT